jgi:hypothetical protein
MVKHIRTWLWNEQLNTTQFKLGGDIAILLNENVFIPDFSLSDAGNNYKSVDKTIPHINSYKNSVYLIWYQKYSKIPFFSPTLWECEMKEFEKQVNQILAPVNIPTNEDYLYVVFTDNFVRYVAFIRGRLLAEYQKKVVV